MRLISIGVKRGLTVSIEKGSNGVKRGQKGPIGARGGPTGANRGQQEPAGAEGRLQ